MGADDFNLGAYFGKINLMNLREMLFIRGIKSLIARYFKTRKSFGFIAQSSVVTPPVTLSGGENINISDDVNIGANSLMYATHATITIKKGFVAATGLKLITGGHERRVGHFLYSITDAEKDLTKNLDRNIIIEEDVWAGMDVMILRGCTIGRGCTLAARSVVTKSTPPYSIVGGVPAQFIKFYWTVDEILEHEKILYPEDKRYTREYLEELFCQYVEAK